MICFKKRSAIGEKVWYFFQTKYKFVSSFGVNDRKTIELEYSAHLTQEALKVTMELNNAYNTPEELQDLFAKLTGNLVNRSLALVAPFYTDCGKIFMLARRSGLAQA